MVSDSEPISEQRAAEQWRQLGGSTPASVETLKPPKRKSAVYLLRAGAGEDVVAKRARVATIATEHAIYGMLRGLPIPSIKCFGMAAEPDTDYAWLFTEYVDGDPFAPGKADHAALAGTWLATVHSAAASFADRSVRLPRRDIAHYGGIIRSARDTVQRSLPNTAFSTDDRGILARIAQRCDALERLLGKIGEVADALPATLVHGGFGAKNVRIRHSEVLAFDWEAGGWGTPAADLANADVDAYHETLSFTFPTITRAAAGRLALLGRLLASVSAIPGEERSLAGAWPHRVLAKMRVYERRMADAQSALGLEG